MKPSKNSATPMLLTGGWLTLGEALEQLGKSQSTLERLVGSRAIASRLEPRPGRKPERLYRAEDIGKQAERNGAGNTRSLATVKKLTPPVLTPSALDAVMTKWEDRQQRAPVLVPIAQKLWLTVPEAAAYSGFGEGFLLGLIDRRLVRAAKHGPRGSWVIQRKSLEQFEIEGGGG